MLLFLILGPISEFSVFYVQRTSFLYWFNLLKVFLYSRYVLRILSLLGLSSCSLYSLLRVLDDFGIPLVIHDDDDDDDDEAPDPCQITNFAKAAH